MHMFNGSGRWDLIGEWVGDTPYLHVEHPGFQTAENVTLRQIFLILS